MSKCIYCEKQTDLNTQLTITLDGGKKVTVDICDEHADDATVKTAREAYLHHQQQIETFLEQAKALGFVVQDGPNGLAMVQPQQVPQAPQPVEPQPVVQPIQQQSVEPQPVVQQPIQQQPAQPQQPITEGEGWIDTSRIDNRRMTSKGGAVSGVGVESYVHSQVGGQQDVLPNEVRRGKVRMQVVQGRCGQPLALPEQRVDGTGTTRVVVAQTEDDNKLQRRFKEMADTSRSSQDNAAGPDFRNGYSDGTRNCPICYGACTIDDQTCPKCKGLGYISIY